MKVKWKTIDTAPKDGRPILGYARGTMTVVSWYAARESPHGWWNLVEPGAYAEDEEWSPTHWTALPGAPEVVTG